MIPGSTIMGRKARIVVMTPAVIGKLYSLSAIIIADLGSCPTRIFALAACTITMIVSTAIPNERMKEKFVRKLRENQKALRRINVAKNARGSVSVAKRESKNPTKSHIQINTRTVVIIASFVSSL